MQTTLVATLCSLSWMVLVTAASPPNGQAEVPPRKQVRWAQTSVDGKVLTLTDDSITIRQNLCGSADGVIGRTGSRGVAILTGNPLRFTLQAPDGKLIQVGEGVVATTTREAVVVVAADGTATSARRHDYPPRMFKVSPILAAGRYEPLALDYQAYRLADVKIGDEVSLDLLRRNDDPWVCVRISIQRRPGGRVPPSNKPSSKNPWHDRANAMQDWEEKGVPVPDKSAVTVPDTISFAK